MEEITHFLISERSLRVPFTAIQEMGQHHGQWVFVKRIIGEKNAGTRDGLEPRDFESDNLGHFTDFTIALKK